MYRWLHVVILFTVDSSTVWSACATELFQHHYNHLDTCILCIKPLWSITFFRLSSHGNWHRTHHTLWSLQTTSWGKPSRDTSRVRPAGSWNMFTMPYFVPSLTNTTYEINSIEPYECSIYVSSLILWRRSSKPNDVSAENGTTKSKLVLVSSSVNSIKSAFSWVVGLFEVISCRTWRRDSVKRNAN